MQNYDYEYSRAVRFAQTKTDETIAVMKRYRILKFLNVALVIGFFLLPAFGQKKVSCRVGTTTFACPKDFVKLPDVNPETRLFRSKAKDEALYIFVVIPSGDFVDLALKKALEKYYVGGSNDSFQWKVINNPLTMDVDTKYENNVAASFGFRDKHLLELKYFTFSVKGKNILIGYVADWGEEPGLNKRLFEKGEGIGDTAVGCNAVVTILNSITKEFKERQQYCSLTTIRND